jgi:hypothetical protein
MNRWTTPYQEDTGKEDQGQSFLAGGSAPLEPIEDDPTIMDVATLATGENSGTYKTPK